MLNPQSTTPANHEPSRPAPPPLSVRNVLLRIYNRTLIFLLLYVLSTGPMYWSVYEAYNMGGSSFLARFYAPIAALCQVEFIADWFDWYIGLWVL